MVKEFVEYLVNELENRIAAETKTLAVGGASNWENYKERVAAIREKQRTIEMLPEIVKRFDEDD